MAPFKFQIVSDLHLDNSRLYDTWIKPSAPYLALLGDIGIITPNHRDQLAQFLRMKCLKRFKVVFYVPGNHEAYWTSWESVRTFFANFKREVNERRSRGEELGEFVLLDQGRYDLDSDDKEDKLSVLGCTLFTHVPPAAEAEAQRKLDDFRKTKNWTVACHNAAHAAQLGWLNSQVEELEGTGRRVAIFTHHSPTVDDRTVPLQYRGTDLNTAYSNDLSREPCWTSEAVRLWAFGHTHHNCDYVDAHGKRVYTNQKGYGYEDLKHKGYEVGRVVEV
ncbi:Metallo-dependent phosphatase-like protein [Lasiosphaeris hirsuta]|uniref:Metallo-dependent phosphatase-like protein n=1 Tax=Lasiosphaeris hirsuta TaxID=260670 RepID=A0AA40DLA5_9PEZI|nr:Metallo-dependent phosphatase-like protein [Lasiosphaeris hirsuta]